MMLISMRPMNVMLFFLSLPLPPRSTLFPYTTLFRSSSGLRRTRGCGRRGRRGPTRRPHRSEEHTSELQSRQYLVCRLRLEKKNAKASVVAIDVAELVEQAPLRRGIIGRMACELQVIA